MLGSGQVTYRLQMIRGVAGGRPAAGAMWGAAGQSLQRGMLPAGGLARVGGQLVAGVAWAALPGHTPQHAQGLAQACCAIFLGLHSRLLMHAEGYA